MEDFSTDVCAPESLFKSHKRKRIFRQREDDGAINGSARDMTISGNASSISTILPPNVPPVADKMGISTLNARQATPQSSPEPETSLSVAEILRRRRAAQIRRRGIEFSNSVTANNPASGEGADAGTMILPEKINPVDFAAQRFAPQTGVVAEANSMHMTAYIESELARLRAGPTSASIDTTSIHGQNLSNTTINSRSGISVPLPQRQPAALGQIHEIDLGPDAAARNAARTEEMARRLAAGQRLEDEPVEKERPRIGRDGKPILGKDGKPLMRRRRNRRGSDDVKRDMLVEDVLKESKLDIYTPDDPSLAQTEEDTAADDAVAEKFRRDFLDAVQSRNSRRSAPSAAAKNKPVPGRVGKPGDDLKSRGPKLGGSRSARAAMHAAEKEKGKVGKR